MASLLVQIWHFCKVTAHKYNVDMTLHAVQIRPDGNIPIPNIASSLDEVTGSLPSGFYTTFSSLAQGTRVLGLQAHLDRLYLPAKERKLKPAVDENTLRERIAELVKENLPHESRVRLILTKERGEIFTAIQPFIPLAKEIYENGVHVITSTVARSDPRIKGTDFIAKSAEQRKLVRGDVFEILLTHNGKILEGMTSNFYAIVHPVIATKQSPITSLDAALPPKPAATLLTAQKEILLGVTRRAVLKIARGQGLSIEYRPLRVGEKFDEAFLTSSSRGVVPIISIDESLVGQGQVGAWAKTLSKAYQAYVWERSEKIVR
mgnify:CR=1 FL=1